MIGAVGLGAWDWVFLFWGEADADLPEIPFFTAMDEPLVHAWSARQWPISFTRFIENTVDIAHLGKAAREAGIEWRPQPYLCTYSSCRRDGSSCRRRHARIRFPEKPRIQPQSDQGLSRSTGP